MARTKTSFKKGNPGRKAGTPNKATKNLREFITGFLHDNKQQLQKDFKKLNPRDRMVMFERLLKYALPALQSTTLDVNFDKMTDEQLDYIIEKLKANQE